MKVNKGNHHANAWKLGLLMNNPVEAAVRCILWMKSTIIFLVLLCLFVFFHLHMLFTFSALISNIYWCGIVLHQQILMVQHVAPVEIIGAAQAAPTAPLSTPMDWCLKNYVFFGGSAVAQW